MNLNNWKNTTFTGENSQNHQKLEQCQEMICAFFAESSIDDDFDKILNKFEQVFINYQANLIPELVDQSLQTIIKSDSEVFFRATIKRCCYLLIYPFLKAKKYTHIIKIINIFAKSEPEVKNISLMRSGNLLKNKLKLWLNNFANSNEYRELKILIYQFDVSSRNHWTHHYLEYLFFLQYFNSQNSQEQKQVAFLLIKNIRKEFKLNLAIDLTKFQFAETQPVKSTILNDQILQFIKKIAAKQGKKSYKNIAKIFIEQTKNITYEQFKKSFIKYLKFSISNENVINLIELKLGKKLQEIYQDNTKKIINEGLLLRTCNKALDLLITNQEKPSELFILLISQNNAYAIVIIILKIVLISPNCRSHLEKKIAELLNCYQDYTEKECQWFIKFIELLRVTVTIYAEEDAEYNLVRVENKLNKNNAIADLDSYQFFLKYKKN